MTLKNIAVISILILLLFAGFIAFRIMRAGNLENYLKTICSKDCCASHQGMVAMAQVVSQPSAKVGDLTVDPVSQALISINDNTPHVIYKGEKYYSCCTMCAAMATAYPEKYLDTGLKKIKTENSQHLSKSSMVTCVLSPSQKSERAAYIKKTVFSNLVSTRQSGNYYEFYFQNSKEVYLGLAELIELEKECCKGVDFQLSDKNSTGYIVLKAGGSRESMRLISEFIRENQLFAGN